jgi:L-methionine (R)-S-oxide reductase
LTEFKPIPYSDKAAFYRELNSELRGLYEEYWFTNLANTAAALMAHLPRLNWAGFYLYQDGELRLGPFQGLPACLRIAIGKGVCGDAAQRREPLIVPDVDRFPGHIACDRRSRSEIVLPILYKGRLLGVLDIDSPELDRFDDADLDGLSAVVNQLTTSTRWPESFA